MNVINLSDHNSLLQNFIAELRDKDIQQDSLRFRRNLERIGEIMAYEISKKATYTNVKTKTPLGIAQHTLSTTKYVLCSILRAGIPFHNGFLNYFDQAENAFVSAYRKYVSKTQFDVHVEYISSPDLNDKTMVLVDPMLASGLSFTLAFDALKAKGIPKYTHLCAIIASKEGVNYVRKFMNNEKNITLWVGAIDDDLNDKSYIIPGLGDAGDLAYGKKRD